MELLLSSPPKVETLEKARHDWMRYCEILQHGIELLRARNESRGEIIDGEPGSPSLQDAG